MESYTENFGPWQGFARSGGVLIAPVAAASYRATRVPTAALAADAVSGGLGQPAVVTAPRTHKSMHRPGSPPRGRLR